MKCDTSRRERERRNLRGEKEKEIKESVIKNRREFLSEREGERVSFRERESLSTREIKLKRG